jgi:AraC-like DNA-binding protein
MAVICDTSSVPVEDRAELWVEASSQLFVPLECRPRDLLAPSRTGETVASIGSRWGVTNSARLSRLFRDAYGLSPTEYLAEQLRGGDGAR